MRSPMPSSTVLLSPALALALGLAAGACDLSPAPATTGHVSQASLGGTPDGAFPSVCVMKVQPPPDDMDNPRDPYYCSCSLVEAQTVLTSASCVYDNAKADKIGPSDIDLRFGTGFASGTQVGIDSIEIERYYDPDKGTDNDLALIRLSEAPAQAPVELSVAPLGQDAVGMDLILVGFGERMDTDTDVDVRNQITTPITQVDKHVLYAGTPDKTSCAADSGGPGFVDAGDGPVQVSVTEARRSCDEGVPRTRVDVYAQSFLFPFIDRYSGPCKLDGTCVTDGCRSPDPDCGDGCAWEGGGQADCVEDCPTRDWDCPLGSFVGEACDRNGDCEEGGHCVAAADDETFTYCTRPCDPADSGSCPTGMACTDVGESGDVDNECTYLTPSPGSQGAACDLNSQCRSNICEDGICVYPCPDGTCADPYTCGPSKVAGGESVCLGQTVSGGGGFCAAGGDPGHTGLVGLLLGLGFLPFVLRRRRVAR